MSYLIIGAGPCGLAMARSLRRYSIPYEQVEAEEKLGGNWSHGVYDSVYTDACKEVMQYPEFPMPSSYPDFLSRQHMLEYLNAYAEHFQLASSIRFKRKVVWIAAAEQNKWQVTFDDHSSRVYDGVIVCNGHHWDMQMPSLPGQFTGELIHSKQYKQAWQLRGKRVLVIGSGNSAADIACEAARVSSSSVMSMRDSPWIFPKSFMGIPLGRHRLKNLPAFLQPFLIKWLIRLSFGKHSDYHLPAPRHKPFDKHPTVSEELPYYLRHGRVAVKPAVSAIEGKRVFFSDESNMEFDMIVAATGYHLSFPFLPKELVRKKGKHLQCLGYSVYPDYKGLFFLGWPQVRGGIGSLASAFSRAIAIMIRFEEASRLPVGKILEAMQEKPCTTHLFGAKELTDWIKRHPFRRLMKYAEPFTGMAHVNKTTLAWEGVYFEEKKAS